MGCCYLNAYAPGAPLDLFLLLPCMVGQRNRKLLLACQMKPGKLDLNTSQKIIKGMVEREVHKISTAVTSKNLRCLFISVFFGRCHAEIDVSDVLPEIVVIRSSEARQFFGELYGLYNLISSQE